MNHDPPSAKRKHHELLVFGRQLGGNMFLVEEKLSLNGQRRAEIYMRPDGLFEGRIYRHEREADCGQAMPTISEFEVCGVTETLRRVEAIVDEELGL
jgi:hypothetical protein